MLRARIIVFSGAAVTLCFFTSLALAQDATKQKAIRQMRQIAKAVKECPQETDREPPPHNQCFGTEAKAGPPVNVIWDVEPGQSARAPYQGSLEFDLPSTWAIAQLQPNDKKVAKACDRNYRIQASIAEIWAKATLGAQLGLGDDVELPRSRVWHYRFELDLGSGNPELVKMLWMDETGKVQAVMNSHSCWVKAAQSSGTSRSDVPTPSPTNEP